MSLCVKKIDISSSSLAISSLHLHTLLSIIRPQSFVLVGGESEPLQPSLCLPLWREKSVHRKEDGGNTVTEESRPIVTATKADEQLGADS